MNEITVKDFLSKKNSVSLVESGGVFMVKKIYSDLSRMENEIRELDALKGQNAPKIIRVEDNRLYMTYIEGELFLDAFLKGDLEELKNLASMLADFIKAYSSIRQGRALTDLNFRNFILSGGALYGVDFEETEAGELSSPIHKAAAFSLFYDIPKEHKRYFIKELFSASGIPINKSALRDEADKLSKRRNIPQLNIGDYLD